MGLTVEPINRTHIDPVYLRHPKPQTACKVLVGCIVFDVGFQREGWVWGLGFRVRGVLGFRVLGLGGLTVYQNPCCRGLGVKVGFTRFTSVVGVYLNPTGR